MIASMPRGGKRPGAGRPKKYGRAALSEVVTVRATRDEVATWTEASKSKGLILSEWIRYRLNKSE